MTSSDKYLAEIATEAEKPSSDFFVCLILYKKAPPARGGAVLLNFMKTA